MRNGFGFKLGAAAVALSLLMPANAMASDWAWGVTLYGWFSSIGMDVSINDQEIAGGEVNVKDLVDQLDFMAQVNVQGQKGQWGLLLDASFYDFGDDQITRPLPGPVGAEFVAQGDMEMLMADVGALWNPQGDGFGFTLVGGVRIIDITQEVLFWAQTPDISSDPRYYKTSGTLVDGFVGARYTSSFAEKWLFNLKADVSTGDTEFTWDAMALFGYSWGPDRRYSLLGGYKYMSLELEEKNHGVKVETDVAMSGPIVGFRIGF